MQPNVFKSLSIDFVYQVLDKLRVPPLGYTDHKSWVCCVDCLPICRLAFLVMISLRRLIDYPVGNFCESPKCPYCGTVESNHTEDIQTERSRCFQRRIWIRYVHTLSLPYWIGTIRMVG